jgi:hypothetical protein
MTDRVNGFFVTLDEDMRIDDAEAIMNAIRMVRRVVDVSPNVADPSDWVAQTRVRLELTKKMLELIRQD